MERCYASKIYLMLHLTTDAILHQKKNSRWKISCSSCQSSKNYKTLATFDRNKNLDSAMDKHKKYELLCSEAFFYATMKLEFISITINIF